MQTKKMLFTAIAFLVFSFTANAQNKENPKPYVVHTMYLNINAENFRTNLDSLLKVFKKNVMDPNSYFVSSKIVTHFWGHDSREVLIMCELKSMDDLETAFQKQNSLLREYAQKNKGFRDLWISLFLNPEHHSDEIYRVVE